jgi:aminopeptidase
MQDPRVAKLASILVRYSTAVEKGDEVVMLCSPRAEALCTEVYREVLRAGAHPWVRMAPSECGEIFLKNAKADQLAHVSPFDKHAMKTANVYMNLGAPDNTKAMSGVDPRRQAAASQARRPIFDVFMKRAALPHDDPKRLRWTGTIFPNQASAQDAEMSLREYEEFVFGACKLGHDNPVASWKKLGKSQQRLADFLQKGKEMHIRAPNGTDIRFGIEGRTWINCDGKENFPDGEVFTGPIEDATEGTVCYSFPAVHGGREVNDIRLVFSAGKVVECSASHNEEFLIGMLDQDKGARVLGELALGSNYDIKRYTKNTLFDEKIGGTFHAAVGAAYPESGGTNKSGLHWDMVCDLRKGGTVEVDGKLVSKNGRFQKASWPQP